MLRMIGRRILVSVPLLLVVSVIVFWLQALIPGDAALQIGGLEATPAQTAQLRLRLGLDQPLWAQYWHWLDQAVHGSLGTSLINQQNVTGELNGRLPVTLSLVVGATLVATVIGVLLGIASSMGWPVIGRVVDVISIGGLAVPSFWLGLLLISLFSVQLGWLPSTGYVSFANSPSDWLESLVLPVAALGLAGVTVIAKQTREAMLDVLQRDFIRNLRANGIPERSIIFRHALRSAAIPVVTISGLVFVGALGGSVVIENVFGLPGLGSLAVTATSSKDIPIILGVAMYFTLLVIAVNLLTDIAYRLINAKVRHS
jgi:peptide/nickel transport system permease protein